MDNKTSNFFSKLLIVILLKGTLITGAMGYDYYWRDYDGISNIPDDALEVIQGSNTYIGQVYVQNKGIFVGTIHKGQDFIEVSGYGDKTLNKLIKILCTDIGGNPPDNLWITTNKDNFHVDIIGNNPIIGGYDYLNQGYLNIGRVQDGSVLVVGSVTAFAKDVYLYYADQRHDHKAEAFQFLANPLEK